jgi:hypothetical protein
MGAFEDNWECSVLKLARKPYIWERHDAHNVWAPDYLQPAFGVWAGLVTVLEHVVFKDRPPRGARFAHSGGFMHYAIAHGGA